MSEKILIASDSTSDLSPELINKYGIKTIPLFVNLGGKLFADGGDITPDDIYEHYEKTRKRFLCCDYVFCNVCIRILRWRQK